MHAGEGHTRASPSVRGIGFWAKRSLAGLKDSRGRATEPVMSQVVPISPSGEVAAYQNSLFRTLRKTLQSRRPHALNLPTPPIFFSFLNQLKQFDA